MSIIVDVDMSSCKYVHVVTNAKSLCTCIDCIDILISMSACTVFTWSVLAYIKCG